MGGRLWQAGGVLGSTRKEKITFPCCTSGGRRKGNSVVQNDTVLHIFFYMKRRRFMKNAPFHLKVAPASFFQISP